MTSIEWVFRISELCANLDHMDYVPEELKVAILFHTNSVAHDLEHMSFDDVVNIMFNITMIGIALGEELRNDR